MIRSLSRNKNFEKRKDLAKSLEKSLTERFFESIEDKHSFEVEKAYQNYKDFYNKIIGEHLTSCLEHYFDVTKAYSLWRKKSLKEYFKKLGIKDTTKQMTGYSSITFLHKDTPFLKNQKEKKIKHNELLN